MTIHALHEEGSKMANTQRRSSKKRTKIFHTWDIDQIIALVEMVVSDGRYPRINWEDIAARHNEKFISGDQGRSPKAVEGMFGRIRDGFMYLQNERIMTLMIENESLWQRQRANGRSKKRDDEVEALRAQVEEQSKQINQLLEVLTSQSPGTLLSQPKAS